jgi:Na+-driven multidrug efflux pump
MAMHGIVALLVAVAALILLRGVDARIVLLFGLPPTLAALYTGARSSRGTRRIAWAFLGAIGLGSLIAPLPQLFPKLGGFAQLPPEQNRMLTWYVGVYAVWLAVVLPVHVFVGGLRAHGRGEPALLSEFTCSLGLVAVVLFSLVMPGVLALLGFWPIV